MTKQEAVANHRKMWRWIADETERRECAVKKDDYFNAMGILEEDRPFQLCYCCEYEIAKDKFECASCPIEWPGERCYDGGLYTQWIHVSRYDDWRKAAALARQIAELPEKEEMQCD